MQELVGALRSYAWGSRTALAQLCGRPVPSAHPEAELWFGAHPADPAHVRTDSGTRSLLEVLIADPAGELGTVADTFGARLPFLLKILAAEEPLSLQAHPSSAQARAGFERENRTGVALRFAAAQLPRRQPQTGTGCRAGTFRGAGRVPRSAPHRRSVARAGCARPRHLRRTACRPARFGRTADPVHHLDHAAARRAVQAAARGARGLCDATCRARARASSPPRCAPRSNWPRSTPATRVCSPRCCSTASDAAARPGPVPRGRQSARVPARARCRDHGQLRQRVALADSPPSTSTCPNCCGCWTSSRSTCR